MVEQPVNQIAESGKRCANTAPATVATSASQRRKCGSPTSGNPEQGRRPSPPLVPIAGTPRSIDRKSIRVTRPGGDVVVLCRAGPATGRGRIQDTCGTRLSSQVMPQQAAASPVPGLFVCWVPPRFCLLLPRNITHHATRPPYRARCRSGVFPQDKLNVTKPFLGVKQSPPRELWRNNAKILRLGQSVAGFCHAPDPLHDPHDPLSTLPWSEPNTYTNGPGILVM